MLCLFLKTLVPLGSCKTNSQNFANGSLPKREQTQFYLELSKLVHQEKKKHRNKQRSEIYLFSTISMTSTSAQVNLDCLNHDIVEPKCSNYHKIHEIFLEISSFFAFLLLSERNGSAKKRAKQVYFLRKFWIIFIFLVNYRWHCTLKKL